MVPESRFGLQYLRLHPVWARFYEPNDIDVACSLGLDRDEFKRQLERAHHGSDHAMFPVFSLDQLPDDLLDIYVRASFVPARGDNMDGYIAADARFICLYPNDSTYFSFTAMSSINDGEVARFQSHAPEVTLFPLRYSTPYQRADGTDLIGTFDPA